jgi:hypothetical protein
MENWYVIAIPTIALPATMVLDPGYGFPLELSVEASPETLSNPPTQGPFAPKVVVGGPV